MMDYNALKNLLNGRGTVLAETQDKEVVLIEHLPKGRSVDEHYKVTTLQKNGWARVNCYYEDGTIDETFER